MSAPLAISKLGIITVRDTDLSTKTFLPICKLLRRHFPLLTSVLGRDTKITLALSAEIAKAGPAPRDR